MLKLSRVRLADPDGGAIGVYLAIVVAFALFAVTQLTRTELAARTIDQRVDYITTQTDPINKETSHLTILDKTDDYTKQIRAAAEPLSAQAGQIIDAAKSIDTSVGNIKSSTDPINATVRGIGGTVGSINGTAKSINGTVGGIFGTFTSLNPLVSRIAVGSGPFSIEGVANIDRRASVVINQVNAIKADLDNTLNKVGSINGHTVSICKSPPVSLLPGTGGLAGLGLLNGLSGQFCTPK